MTGRLDLSVQEIRVLGCLVEKQLTTPQQYPLTLNALTLACNQSSNRDPVVSYDERATEAAITSAKNKGFARFVHPSHGRSAIRYAHMLEEALGADRRQLALLSVLMLRGPQTPGELRSRTERMEHFEDLADVEAELNRLSDREDPLVSGLERRPGQKEVRFAHLLAGTRPVALSTSSSIEDDLESPTARTAPAPNAGPGGPDGPYRQTGPLAPIDPLAPTERARLVNPVGPSTHAGAVEGSLAEAVARLREEVDELRRDLDILKEQLGA